MKVVHVIVDLDVGGAELMLQRLLMHHRERAAPAPRTVHEVVSLTTIGPVGEALRNAGFRVDALGMSGGRDLWRVLRALRRRFRSDPADVVQTWMYHADLVGGLAARWAGCKAVIWGVHSTYVSFRKFPATALVRAVCAVLSYVVPRRILCVAQLSQRVHVQLGYDRRKFIVIPNGFDVDHWRALPEARGPLRETWGLGPAQPLVVSVGRFNHDKDHATFLAAAAQVRAARPDVRFVLVGKGLSADNAALMAMVETHGLQPAVLLLGPRQDVREILSAGDVYCLHSRTEAFPLALGEAMSVGLPCASTEVGDARVLLGDAGRIAPPEDPPALAQALLDLLALSGPQRAVLGQRARQRVQTLFSMDTMATRVEQLYDDVCRGGGR